MITIEATGMTAEIITHTTLRELAAAGAVCEAAAVAHGSRWALVVRYGGTERVLAARKTKQPRSWAHLDSLVRYLAEIGIRQFTTDARNYDPDQPGQKRPDRAEALRQAHEAAEYDRWFREQVQQALDEADSPDAQWLTTEELFDGLEKRLARKHGARPA